MCSRDECARRRLVVHPGMARARSDVSDRPNGLGRRATEARAANSQESAAPVRVSERGLRVTRVEVLTCARARSYQRLEENS